MTQPSNTLSRLPSPVQGRTSPDGRFKSSTLPVSGSPPSTLQIGTPPSRVRSYTETHSTHLRPDLHSLPSTPPYSPRNSSTNVHLQPYQNRRLLMPTVRATRPQNSSPRTAPSNKSSPAKLSRSRAGSTTALQPSPELNEHSTTLPYTDWIGGGRRFEVVEEQIELEGFQIYAVEKWVVERHRPVITLTVYTGDPQHKITVTALRPQSSLSPAEAQREWDDALRSLRRDGARPKEDKHGILMVTSLANFRSDFTIVPIPNGNFLDIREQLYTNINVLRMGCSGRSALTLEQPSETTKDRFIAMYHIPDKANARSSALFNATVLELVKMIQAALTIFGIVELSPEERNGLLCDVTTEGIQRWVAEIGEPCMKVEPMERVGDPTVVAAMLSLIMAIRHKLHALGHAVTKDPFNDPASFLRSLASFAASKPFHIPSTSGTAFYNTSPNLGASTTALTTPSYLTPPLIEAIQTAYDKKTRQGESYKMHRVLISKLDDLATDLRTTATSGVSANPSHADVSNLDPTADLEALVKAVTGGCKDAPQSLRYLWTGRPGQAKRKRKEKESFWSDGEKDRDDKDAERDYGGRDGREKDGRDGRERRRYERDREKSDSSDDDGDGIGGMRPWSGRVQRKIEHWAAIGRTKKLSVDFGALGRVWSPESPLRGNDPGQTEQSQVPSVVVSREPDDDEVLSSGQVSPITASRNPSVLGLGSFISAQHSTSELSDYDKRVTEFNQKRPSTRPRAPLRILSWSDPLSAREMVSKGSPPHEQGSEKNETAHVMASDEATSARRSTIASGPRRCKSFDDVSALDDTRILPVDRMQIDVELSGQLLVMWRRERHLANVVACLQALSSSLARTNASIRADHEAARPDLTILAERASVLQHIEATGTRADALTQETQALAYETAQFLVEDLWHMALQPRRRVLAMREKVFGTGRRLPQGVHGAHGRYNRVQWTLDGNERLVDALGRTESEAEEEQDLPHESEPEETEEEVDAVENLSLKPTWLLRLFNYWGSKWGKVTQDGKANMKMKEKEKGEADGGSNSMLESAASTSRIPDADSQLRSRVRAQTG